jgi:filamentous hemagglutinin family protein
MAGHRAALLRAAASIALIAAAQSAAAQPIGATIVSGQAAISGTPGATVITQSTSKAIINWQSFSVGAGASVQFQQPDAASITLNRVTGTGLSSIEGAIKANGQVWLINPNGVLFGQGATVNVAGLLATTADIANNDFVSGNYAFAGAPAGSSVVNQGVLSATRGGAVVLSASKVVNKGLIAANAGHVVLGGAEAFTVDFKGDHLLSYAVTAPAHGTDAGVSNEGVIKAPGGQVLMTARAADRIADGVVNNSGMVEATSAHAENGEIVLDAGDGGAVNSGTLDASGKGAGETGGAVKLLGKSVTVADTAKIDVSGDASGGTALIGGNLHGAGPEANAQTVTVGKASIKADAISRGNGGTVAVYSTGHTKVAASISARGGAQSGNGGQVETSGHTLSIDDATSVVTAAPYGAAGNWLLDPHNITISTGGNDPVSPQGFSDTPATDVTISPTTIANALANGTVTLQANTDITVASSITVSGGNGNTLALYAGRSIQLTNGSSINFAAGNLFLSANDSGANPAFRDAGVATISSGSTGGVTAANLSLILASDGQDGSAIGSSGTPFLVNGSTPTYIQTSGANAFVSVPDGTSTSFSLGNPIGGYSVNMTGGNLSIRAAGVTQNGLINVKNLTVTLPNSISSGNPVTLTDPNNLIAGTVNIAAMGGSELDPISFIKIFNSEALTIGTITDTPDIASTNYGSLELTAIGGGMTLTGNIDAGLITLGMQGNLTQTGGVLHSHATDGGSGGLAITASQGGSITMPNANILDQVVTATGNDTAVSAVGQLVFSAEGSASVNFASSLQLQGAYAQNGAVSITTTGSYTLQQGGNTVTKYNEIDINNPITATGMVTLHAAGDVLQPIVDPSRDVPITTATGLVATSDHGNIVLNDGGNGAVTDTGAGTVADGGNKVGGYVLLNSSGDASFANTIATTLGTPVADDNDPGLYNFVIGGNLSVTVADAPGGSASPALTLDGRLHVQGMGDTTLHAAGDLINNNGDGTIYADHLNLITDNGGIGTGSWSFGDGAQNSVPLNLYIATGSTSSAIINPGDVNFGGTALAATSGYAVQTPYLLVFGNGTVTQDSATSGILQIGAMDIHAANNVTLTNTLNAITGEVDFRTPGTISFTNSVNTFLARANGGSLDSSNNPNLAGAVTITVQDTGGQTQPTLTLGNSTDFDAGNAGHLTSIDSGGAVTLLADGAITDRYDPSDAATSASAGHVTGASLSATSSMAAISLLNPGNNITYNPGTTTISLTANGNIDFANSQGISLSAYSSAGSLHITTNDSNSGGTHAPIGIYGAISAPDPSAVSLLHASGDIVNQAGPGIESQTLALVSDFGAIGTSGSPIQLLPTTGGTAQQVQANAPGDIYLQSIQGFNIASAGLTDPATGTPIGAGGLGGAGHSDILITNGGNAVPLTQGANAGDAIAAGSLTINDQDASGSAILLNNGGNAINGVIAMLGLDSVSLTNAGDTVLGSSSAGGALTVQSGGSVTINAGAVLSSNASGDGAVVLAAQTGFINNAGANALSMPNAGGFQIFSRNPSLDTFGGLDSGNTALFGHPSNVLITDSGNRYAFADKQTLTVAAGALNKTYGDDATSAVAADYTISGIITGVANAYLADPNRPTGTPSVTSSGAAASADVGSYAITAGAGSFAADNNYNIVYQGSTLTVGQRTLTVALQGSVSKTYDGSTSAALAAGNYTALVNLVNGDDVSLATFTSGTYADVAAGSGKTVTAKGLTLTGAKAMDYTIASSASANIGIILQKMLTTSLQGAATKVYDGTTSATVMANNFSALSGVIGNDAVSLVVPGSLSGRYADAEAGIGKSVTVNGLALGGAQSGNYTIATSISGNIGIIQQKTLTTALQGAVTKTYDGTSKAILAADNYAALSGVVNGDSVSLANFTSGSYADAEAGSGKTVSVMGLSLSGAQAQDYTISASLAGAVGTILQKPLTIALQGGVTKVFDGTTSAALTSANYGALNGLVNGDAVALASYPASGSFADAGIGTGKVITVGGLVLAGAKSADYSLPATVSGAIGTITAPVTIDTGPSGNTNIPVDGSTNAQIVAVSSANQNAVNQPTRPGTFYLETGTAPATSQAPAAVPAPVVASLVPATASPIAEMAAASSAADADAGDPTSPAQQASDALVASLDGTGKPGNGGVVIPGLLRAAGRTRSSDSSGMDALSGGGNAALWQ